MPGAEDVPKNHAIKMLPRTGFEPVTYGLLLLNRLQSTALPTELSRVDVPVHGYALLHTIIT